MRKNSREGVWHWSFSYETPVEVNIVETNISSFMVETNIKNILWLTSHSPGVRLLNYLGAEHGGRQLGWLRCHGLGWRVFSIVTVSVDNKILIILKFGSAPCHGWTSPVLPPVTMVSIFRWTEEQFREFGKLKHSKPSGIVSVQGKHLY